ncbi:Ig-like domain-containing protein [Halobacteriaceae archaeon SHR40]|uniref:Ig-like domain-containing protein n=1 Tax=Halovenus amylolytica TaxID=2500550 RepID=UPI000FE3D01F
MAILNVQDYGAAGDGSADDTEAIQAAIDDTSKGDTVYIPGTDAYYKVTSGSRAAVQCQTAADNVTIEGDGESSVVKLGDTDDSKNQAAFGAEGDGPTMSGILVRDLVFSGNVSENSNYSANAVSHYPSGTGHDITYRNVICEDSAGTGFANRGVSKITLENVTARNNTRHGFDFTADEDSGVTYDMEAHSIKSVNNGGTGLDFHRGKHLCETFYVENNDSGNKIGSSGGQPERMILRNGQIVGSNSSAWRSTGTGNSDVELENVQILDPEISGLNLRNDHNYTINSDVLVENANTSNSNSGWGCRLDESASLTVNGNLRVQSTNSNHGINHASSGSLEISTYYHSGNDDGALRHTDDGGLSIDERIEQESSYLDVPASGDVGAYAGDGIIDDGGSDDSDDSTSSDDPVFEAWTPQWSSGQSSWGVTSTDSNVEDSVLELTAGSSGRHALSCDTVGTATDVDMLGLVRVPSDDDNSSSWCRLIGRGAGTAGSETGYFVAFRDVPNLGIAKYSGGDSTMLSAESVDFTPGNWYYVRFNLSGSELKARYWSLGEDEPQDWLLTATDSEISGDGWVGVGGWSTDTQQWDTFSVATGGDTAQFVGVDSTPSVSVNNPADTDTVSDTVTVQVAARDTEDSDDALAVEYRIDDKSWTALSYNADSGYYEGSWDTTAVSDGEHALEAVAVDSAGNENSTTITVTTDNAGSGPAVDSLSMTEVETDNADAEFDVSWQVSDADADLASVEMGLKQDSDGSVEDSTTVEVSGESESGTTRLVASGDDGSGNSYSASLQVTDSSGNTTARTTAAGETEETSSSVPSIDRFSISEAGRPNPHADITTVWNVSDADGDLASVEIEVADSTGTVQGVTWTVSGKMASDTDTFKIKDGDGKTFDVSIVVTDTAGESAAETVSVTA